MSSHVRPNQEQSPLWGAVLCWTAILPEQRTEMATIAQQMGASHKLDLTSDVTHLIVGNIDTPKYKYVAKERQDIKVLKPTWLDAVRESWMAGGNTDVAALEKHHRLPTFFGLRVCVTGFEDAVQRQGLMDAVNENGAVYHGDLTKQVTHLVAATGSGKKYDYAGQWGIKRVALEWLADSLDRGMALDESCYGLDRAPEDMGKGAVADSSSPQTHLGKRQRELPRPDELIDDGRRKLRRTASMKLGSQSGNLWADIGSEERLFEHRPEPRTSGTHEPPREEKRTDDRSSLRGGKEHADRPAQTDLKSAIGRPAEHFLHPGDNSNNHYLIFGFDDKKTDLLERHMSQHGAITSRSSRYTAHSNADAATIFWVVPHDADETTTMDNIHAAGIPVHDEDIWLTEVWLEKSLYSKSFIDQTTHPLYEPFIAGPVPGLDGLTICPTTFSGVDLLHFSKAAKSTGARYNETLTRQTSILVCNSASIINPDKLRYARSESIVVVTEQWLWECMRWGELRPVEEYGLDKAGYTQSTSSNRQSRPLSRVPSVSNSRVTPMTALAPRISAVRRQRSGRLEFSTEPRPPPSVYMDAPSERETTHAPLSQQPSQVLQTLSPNLSPRKAAQSFSQKSSQATPIPPVAPVPNEVQEQEEDSILVAADDSVPPGNDTTGAEPEISPPKGPPRPEQALDSVIIALKAHKRKQAAYTLNSTAASNPRPSSLPRKQRPLGRALSGSSTGRPITREHSFDTHTHVETDRPTSRLGPFLLDGDDHAKKPEPVQPSQTLGYEDPEGAALRARLMSKHGGYYDGAADFDDGAAGMERVQSIARVTDVSRDTVEEKNKRRAARRR